MMSEDLNLPASLERLEINPERVEGCKNEQNHFQVQQRRCGASTSATSVVPECSLQTLSLKAECPKGNCQCNKKKDRGEVTVKRVSFKRPILRRSKLNRVALLRAPVLNIKEQHSQSQLCGAKSSSASAAVSSASVSSSPGTSCCRHHHHQQPDIGTPATPAPALPSLHKCSRSAVSPRVSYDSSAVATDRQRTLMTSCATKSTLGLCSVQARTVPASDSAPATASTSSSSSSSNNNNNDNDDDTTIDELASYFDLFVHIPKKMSLMAEMMYI